MTEITSYAGWSIDVREGYPFEGVSLEETDEGLSLDAYADAIEKAIREEYPDADLTYNLFPHEAAGTRITVVSPLSVVGNGYEHAAEAYKAEEQVRSGVQSTMEYVWQNGEFWIAR